MSDKGTAVSAGHIVKAKCCRICPAQQDYAFQPGGNWRQFELQLRDLVAARDPELSSFYGSPEAFTGTFADIRNHFGRKMSFIRGLLNRHGKRMFRVTLQASNRLQYLLFAEARSAQDF